MSALIVVEGALEVLEQFDRIKNLFVGQSYIEPKIQGNIAYPKNGNITWFQSSFALSNTSSNVGTQKIGLATGNVYRSKIDGQLYMQIRLTREIETGYEENSTVWINALDLNLAKSGKGTTQLLLPLGLLALLYFSQN